MRKILVLGLLLALAGCGAPALDTIELEPLLIQAGDLPAGMSGAQVRNEAPGMFDAAPKPVKAVYQQLAQGSDQIGGVTVLLYASDADRDAAYQAIVKGMGTAQKVSDLGTDAQASSIEGLSTDLAFVRCHALAHVRMLTGGDSTATETAAAYARRLDKRLMSAVC